MSDKSGSDQNGCSQCRDGNALEFELSMAFQPIVNIASRQVFAQEALVRGVNAEGTDEVFSRVHDGNRYAFDQACRVRAIELASKLAIPSSVSINFMPNAVYQPERCIRSTLAAADKYNFPIERIIFEITESEQVQNHAHLRNIVQYYKQRGFRTAIDDFGAGYAGLNLLAEMQTDLIKLDLGLIRNVDKDPARQAIIKGTMLTCHELGIEVIAEGVETAEELAILRSFGIELFQGYYFARPAFESLAHIPEGRL